jgi:YVTN family beta-propeller protein
MDVRSSAGVVSCVVSLLVAVVVDRAQAASPAGLLLVANKGDHSLSIVDPAAGKTVATVEESGVTGHEVIASPDGKTAYVPIYGDSGVGRPGTDGTAIDVIDIASHKRVATIDLGKGVRPHCPLFGPDGRLYVTTEITSTITVIDPKTHKVVDQIPTGEKESHMFVLSRDGTRAYTSNVGAGSVSVIDVAAKKVLAKIPVSEKAQRIALSVDERFLFTADQMKPRLAVIDTGDNTVKQWVELPGRAYGTAPTPDGKTLVVVLIGTNQVGLVDLKTMKLTDTLDVPKIPQEVLVEPSGRYAYVSCDQSHQVAVVDLEKKKVEKLIETGAGTDGLAWAAAATP